MAQARDEHTRAELNTARALGSPRQGHPDVRIEHGRVVAPRSLIPEPLGNGNVVRCVEAGRKCAGDLHRSCPFSVWTVQWSRAIASKILSARSSIERRTQP